MPWVCMSMRPGQMISPPASTFSTFAPPAPARRPRRPAPAAPLPDGDDAPVAHPHLPAGQVVRLRDDPAVVNEQLFSHGLFSGASALQLTSGSSGPASGLTKNSLPGSCGITEEGIHMSGPYFSVTHSAWPW